MSGQVVHFEVPYDDADRARGFYREVFGWDIQPMPEMEYNFVQTGPTDAEGLPTDSGYIGGGMLQRQDEVPVPVITIDVADMATAVAAITENGGTVLGEPAQIGEMGFAAYFKDSEGNLMGLWQSMG